MMDINERACKAECLAEKENGHHEAYLTWVHQSDRVCYHKCEMCGWIKPDYERGEIEKHIERLLLEREIEVIRRIQIMPTFMPLNPMINQAEKKLKELGSK